MFSFHTPSSRDSTMEATCRRSCGKRACELRPSQSKSCCLFIKPTCPCFKNFHSLDEERFLFGEERKFRYAKAAVQIQLNCDSVQGKAKPSFSLTMITLSSSPVPRFWELQETFSAWFGNAGGLVLASAVLVFRSLCCDASAFPSGSVEWLYRL